jgi:hypothetical protein
MATLAIPMKANGFSPPVKSYRNGGTHIIVGKSLCEYLRSQGHNGLGKLPSFR